MLASPSPRGSSPVLALCLGFLPAVVALLLSTFYPQAGNSAGFLVFMALASVTCCLVSSFLLFKRGTAISIVGGLLLLLINGFIALCCGCGAFLTLANPH
jgi:glycerol-3-phosphate acyltransferase PlsY